MVTLTESSVTRAQTMAIGKPAAPSFLIITVISGYNV